MTRKIFFYISEKKAWRISLEIRLCIQDLHSRIVSRQVFVVEQGIVSAAFLLFTLSFFKAFDASFVHVHLQMHPIYAGS